MNEAQRKQDATFWSGADAIARRLRLHLATIAMIVGLVSVGAGFAVNAITATVRADVAATRSEISTVRRDIQTLTELQRSREVADSTRYQKTLDVVELAVIALVEPDGSEEKRTALSELRRRRRIVP